MIADDAILEETLRRVALERLYGSARGRQPGRHPWRGGARHTTCHHPENDGRFCGAPTAPGRSYCEPHVRLCYQPLNNARATAALDRFVRLFYSGQSRAA